MDKIVIDGDGPPSATGTNPHTGAPITERTNTMIGLIDAFICEHPDFSLNGAAGCLALTGYEGILGYRTNRKSPTKHHERRLARPVVELLRQRGWSFACHSYGHFNPGAKDMTPFWCADDTRKWKQEVGSLVGPTNLYITPFGAYAHQTGPVMHKIYQAGFRVICPVSDRTTHQRVDARSVLYQSRLHIDGHGLRYSPHIYQGFFDPTQVFDSDTRLDKWRRRR